jgi:hypothetical protein
MLEAIFLFADSAFQYRKILIVSTCIARQSIVFERRIYYLQTINITFLCQFFKLNILICSNFVILHGNLTLNYSYLLLVKRLIAQVSRNQPLITNNRRFMTLLTHCIIILSVTNNSQALNSSNIHSLSYVETLRKATMVGIKKS